MSQILSFQRSASSRVDPGYLGHTQTGETQREYALNCVSPINGPSITTRYSKNDLVRIRA